MTVKDTSSSLSSSTSNISSCHSVDSNNDTNNTSNSNNVRQTSLQYILNQNQNIISSLDYWEFHDNEGDDDDSNLNYSEDSHFDSTHQFNSEYFQYSSPTQQYSSHGKLVPPPPPPPPPSMEMDILKDDQIFSSDELNSIFESFSTVAEGHNLDHNNILNYFNEDGCMKGVNCNNGLLDEEQLAKALGAIAMI